MSKYSSVWVGEGQFEVESVSSVSTRAVISIFSCKTPEIDQFRVETPKMGVSPGRLRSRDDFRGIGENGLVLFDRIERAL